MATDSAALRERNRRRRAKTRRFKLIHIADGVLIAASATLIAGQITQSVAVFLAAGIALFLLANTMVALSARTAIKSQKRSPQRKSALTALIFHAALAAISATLIIFGAIHI
jgi:hypothetical protein